MIEHIFWILVESLVCFDDTLVDTIIELTRRTAGIGSEIGLEFSENGAVHVHGDMDSRFSEALGIINDVRALDRSSFQFNKHQCMRLVDYYSKVGEFFKHVMEVRIRCAILSLDATISVLQKGQVLLTKYTADDWQTCLMTEGLNQGSFEALHLELEACVQSIHEFLEENVPGIMHCSFMKVRSFGSLVPFFSLKELFQNILQMDAESDRIDMLAKIESTKMETERVRGLSREKSPQLHSLDVASEALQREPATLPGTQALLDVASEALQREPATLPGTQALLPSALRIEQSEIQLLQGIGSGGNAAVHKCRWLGREYAVKILNTGDVDGLRDEVEKIRKLRHPNIVPLVGFSVGIFDHSPMIVMELLDGDLRLLLRRHPLSWSKVVDVMHQIATGMAYIHRQGMFHGDLKSMNVLVKDVDGRCEVKITDFGVSQQIPRPTMVNANNVLNLDEIVDFFPGDLRELTEISSDGDSVNSRSFSGKVGTAMWMAPEVLTSSGAGNTLYSAKADVYSFAMLCVELVTGENPYRVGQTVGNIRDHVVRKGKRPRLPEDLPSDLRELIVQCWDEEPERRPAFPEICLRLQKLNVHSQRLQKFSWRSQVLHSSRFRAAMVFVLALVMYWTSVNQVIWREAYGKD